MLGGLFDAPKIHRHIFDRSRSVDHALADSDGRRYHSNAANARRMVERPHHIHAGYSEPAASTEYSGSAA